MDTIAQTRHELLQIARENAVFDGWGEAALQRAIAQSGIEPEHARVAYPRGAIDLALEFHMSGDRELAEQMAKTDLSNLPYSQRVAKAIEIRLDLISADREAVRKASAYFALPQHAADGAKAIWNTSDTIWNGLGDTSKDVNWYTKRATLSAVYSATVLYWLGDESAGFEATHNFIKRRIENVMQFEKFKSRFRASPFGKAFANGPGKLFEHIQAPGARNDLPGSIS